MIEIAVSLIGIIYALKISVLYYMLTLETLIFIRWSQSMFLLMVSPVMILALLARKRGLMEHMALYTLME